MSINTTLQQLNKYLCYLLLVSVVSCGVITSSAFADNGQVPVDLQVKLILTALTYDKNLEARANGELNIGILYFPTSSHSKQEADLFAKTLEGFKNKKISGRSFNGIVLVYADNGELSKKITDKKVDVIYIAQGKKELIEKILKVTQSQKILSCTGKSEYVSSCGVTMAVGLKNQKAKLYLNLSSAKQEGADFSAKFLRVAEIVDERNN
jgi:hypothetical protein